MDQIRSSNDRGDFAVGIERDAPQGRAFTVCDVELFSVGRNSGRLRHGRLIEGAIEDVFPPRAGIWPDCLFLEIEDPDLVRAGHSDVQLAAGLHEVPRAVEGGLRQFSADTPFVSLLACAGKSLDGPVVEVHLADQVVLGVGNIKLLADQRHSLRMIE